MYYGLQSILYIFSNLVLMLYVLDWVQGIKIVFKKKRKILALKVLSLPGVGVRANQKQLLLKVG